VNAYLRDLNSDLPVCISSDVSKITSSYTDRSPVYTVTLFKGSMSVVSARPLLRTLTGTARQLPSKAYTAAPKCSNPGTESTPSDLKPAERIFLDSALRVDQAGEIAANYIYQGQMAVLGRDREAGKLIQVCAQQIYTCPFDMRKGIRTCGSKKRNIFLSWTSCNSNITSDRRSYQRWPK